MFSFNDTHFDKVTEQILFHCEVSQDVVMRQDEHKIGLKGCTVISMNIAVIEVEKTLYRRRQF